MGFVNRIMLMGNTTRDPDLRTLPSGTTVCDFGIATNRVYKTANGQERQETVFVDCTAFGRLAEIVAEFCPRGRALFVEGRLHYETWDDKRNPQQRRSKLSVIVENVQFIGGREQSGDTHRQRELPLGASVRKSEERGTEKAPAAGSTRRGNSGTLPSDAEDRSAAPVKPGAAARKNGNPPAPAAAAAERNAHSMVEEAEQLQDADLPF